MSPRAKNKDLTRLMWDRLSAKPETLELDERTDEEPEDLFVRLCSRGQADDVDCALVALLAEHHANDGASKKADRLRFLRRGLRLCDSLRSSKSKHVLKCIVLLDPKEAWGQHLAELQELAARALTGMPKSKTDLRFWTEVAEKRDSSLPYALNAAIEIDVRLGLDLLCHMHLGFKPKERAGLADWRTILQLATEHWGEDRVFEALESICAHLPEPFTSREYLAHFVQLTDLPSLSDRLRRISLGTVSYEPEEKALPSSSSIEAAEVTRLDPLLSHSSRERVQASVLSDVLEPSSEEVIRNLKKGWLHYPPVQ